MGARYMSFEEHMRDQWKAGRAVGREEGRESFIADALQSGSSPEEISKVMNISLEEVLSIQEKYDEISGTGARR